MSSTAEQQPSHAIFDEKPTTTVGAAGYAVPEPNSRARRSQHKSSQVDSQDCSASDVEPTTATGAAGRVKRVPKQKSFEICVSGCACEYESNKTLG